jgi:CBS domain containing-hemolysin-like protein
MSQAEPTGRQAQPVPDPETDSQAGASDRSPESWLDRLRAAVGLKAPGSFREDLAEALASGDVGDSFSPEERTMLANILRLREVHVADVMVPRAHIEAVEIGASLGGLFDGFLKSGHSRMPIYRDTLDDPVGLVHIKDLMHHLSRAATAAAPAAPGKRTRRKPPASPDFGKIDLSKPLASADLVRNILFVPPSMPVAALLAKMQASRMQMALVIDEYGGTDGLVSLEDVVELVVGDIEDEHDDEEGPMIVGDGEGAFLADARADLADVSKAIGSDLAVGEEGEEVDTVGGLVVSLLGRVPVRGELVAVPGGFEFEILDADPRRIKRLRIHRREQGAPKPKPEPRRRKIPPPESVPDA